MGIDMTAIRMGVNGHSTIFGEWPPTMSLFSDDIGVAPT